MLGRKRSMGKKTSGLINYDSSYYLIRRLVAEHMRPFLKDMIWGCVCMLLVAGTTAALAWLVQPAMDEVFGKHNVTILYVVTCSIIGVTLVKSVAMYGQDVLMGYLGHKIVTSMQLKLYSHLMYADLALIHSFSSGKLISRFNNDINILRLSVSKVLTGIAKDSVMLIALVIIMFCQDFWLALIAFLAFPLAIYPIMRLGKRMRKVSRNTQQELGNFTTQLDETFQGVRVIRSYGREEFEIKRSNSIVDQLLQFYFKSTRTEAAVSPIMEALTGFIIAAVIWYGGSQVIADQSKTGNFFSFIAAMFFAYRPLKSLSVLNTKLQEGLAAAKRLFVLLDTRPQIIEKEDAKALVVEEGSIRFENVIFSYEPNKRALYNITLDVPAGKTVALVGPSGSGKSTIMNLLLRFYDAERGTISIDGQNISHVTFHSLRDAMALVSQDVFLFDDTIRANIAYGKENASEDAIIEAAYNAAAHDFIVGLPQGYDTKIGQQGLKLSGGQRQRIAIARAMLRNAPILLLDEATSALDPISEQQIQAALERLMKGRTTLVIAHRLSTIRNADLIYVLDQGRIVESGTHKELLVKDGAYCKLYRHQYMSAASSESDVP